MNTDHVFTALIEPLRRAIADEGYTIPTPIQSEALPHLLAGRDLLGCAQTGTGKTAAFTLPLLQALSQKGGVAKPMYPRALILAPTRELAAQIGDSLATYGRHLKISHTVIFGGVSPQPQIRQMRRGVHVVVATPGRLLDLMQQKQVHLDRVEAFVLDEADRMLDMGFIPAIRKVIARLPKQRQSLFFSATIPPVVGELAGELLQDPVRITIDPGKPAVERIAQRLMFVDREQKSALLIEQIKAEAMQRVIIFTRTKHGADKVVRSLADAGIRAEAIHGNKSQSARTAALQGFKRGQVRALVATDIASRGIDVDGITHVINYDLPEEPETYVHRIGRTARAGTDGNALSFCSARERDGLRDIQRLIRWDIPVVFEHAYHSHAAQHAVGAAARPEPRGGGNFRRSTRPAASNRGRSFGGGGRNNSHRRRGMAA